MYTGRFRITTENVISLAKAAKALKLKSFEQKCWKFIHGEVDDDGNEDDIPLSPELTYHYIYMYI